MTDLIVRRLLIDLETPFDRHWHSGDAFRTALFNALSMSFPIGEQFFIDSVRNGLKALPANKQDAFKKEVQGFVGQEATHRRIHALFNGHLETQGLPNHWEPRARKRLKRIAHLAPRHHLAITAATEHFTAILAEWLLRNTDLLDAEPRLQTMWLWHASEEAEHKSTAFDLYMALDGSHDSRVRWFRRTTVFFLADTLRQTVTNLRADGQLWKWTTWRNAWQYLFGTRGMVRELYRPWKAYKRRDFHPDQQDSTLSEQWLRENTAAYAPVGTAA